MREDLKFKKLYLSEKAADFRDGGSKHVDWHYFEDLRAKHSRDTEIDSS